MMSERSYVIYGPPAKVTFEIELITDTAGHQQTGGSGASCWGFNQSNIVRHGEQVYAMSWRDDLTLIVFQRLGPGRWLARLHQYHPSWRNQSAIHGLLLDRCVSEKQ
jgi:hypothetical protein